MTRSTFFVVAFLAVGGVLVLWRVLQPEQAGPMTDNAMTQPDTSAVADGDPIVTVALPAELSEFARIGKRIFETKCVVCHGENAAGQNGIAPPLVHRIYEPGHHSDVAFVRAAKNGVQSHHWNFGNMPPIEGLTDADVKYIARYIRELQRENGIN